VIPTIFVLFLAKSKYGCIGSTYVEVGGQTTPKDE
jgi:hypothetical protein